MREIMAELLCLDAIQHCLCRFSDGDRIPPQCETERCADGPGPREKSICSGECAIVICDEELATRVASKVLKSFRKLCIVDLDIETAHNSGNVWI